MELKIVIWEPNPDTPAHLKLYTIHLPRRHDRMPRGFARVVQYYKYQELGCSVEIDYMTSLVSPWRWFGQVIYPAGLNHDVGRPVAVIVTDYPIEMLAPAMAHELSEASEQDVRINPEPIAAEAPNDQPLLPFLALFGSVSILSIVAVWRKLKRPRQHDQNGFFAVWRANRELHRQPTARP